MNVWLKHCAHPGCIVTFPEHYYHDYCVPHSSAEDEAQAKRKAEAVVAKGELGVLYPLSSFIGDGASLRGALLKPEKREDGRIDSRGLWPRNRQD